MWGLTLSVAVALGPGLTTAARAAPTAAEGNDARQLFEAGSLAYDKGRYVDAVRAFEEAYRLLPKPAVAFSLAQAHRRQYFVARQPQHLDRAIELFGRYVEEVTEGRRRPDAVEQLQTLEALRTRRQASAPAAPEGTAEPTPLPGEDPPPVVERAPEPEATPPPVTAATELLVYADSPGSEAAIDGGEFSAVPVFAATTPGRHEVVVRAPGFEPATLAAFAIEGRLVPVEAALEEIPGRLKLTARPGARVLLDGRELGYAPLDEPVDVQGGRHELVVTAPGRVPFRQAMDVARASEHTIDARTPVTGQRRAAWGLLGGGGGLVAAGMVTMGLALHYQRDAAQIDSLRGERNISEAELDRLNGSLDTRDALRGVTIGLLATGVAAGVAGLVLLFADRPRGRGRRGVTARRPG
jgi:hypothetical protein